MIKKNICVSQTQKFLLINLLNWKRDIINLNNLGNILNSSMITISLSNDIVDQTIYRQIRRNEGIK